MAFLEGVYWDLDGTIANTELEAHLPAFNEAFKFFQLDWFWDKETYIKLLKVNGGKNRISAFAKQNNKKVSEDFIIDIHSKKQFFYLELINKGKVSLKRGVMRTIKELYESNVRQFIVTSSSRIQVETLTSNLFSGLKPFDFFVCSEDVIHHKPDPLPYNQAIKLSGIKKENSIVFEDSSPGLRSSLAAGLPTICVETNIPIDFGDNHINCLVDTLGDALQPTNFLVGNSFESVVVDYSFLNNFLKNY